MNMDKSQKASLGCGSLILIALIVMFFGGRDHWQPVEEQVRNLRKDVQRLEKTVEAQTRQIESLKQMIPIRPRLPTRPFRTTQPAEPIEAP